MGLFSCPKKSSAWDYITSVRVETEDNEEQVIKVEVTVKEVIYPILKPFEGTINAGKSVTIDFKDDYNFIAKYIEIINDSETDDLVIWFNGDTNSQITVKPQETRQFSQKEFETLTIQNNSANPIDYRIVAQGEGI